MRSLLSLRRALELGSVRLAPERREELKAPTWKIRERRGQQRGTLATKTEVADSPTYQLR
jgi:hypothetical protein